MMNEGDLFQVCYMTLHQKPGTLPRSLSDKIVQQPKGEDLNFFEYQDLVNILLNLTTRSNSTRAQFWHASFSIITSWIDI